ncbi:hypothetical protein GA0061096_2669 [Fictibacillus enclensis]|uniref:Uncharacterized protein n=1 Tax=Fictibacillus enclensis TaxID=1017270 RepID=A0A0V8J8E9_9BACL|nr:hypothetical protein [Fictibacillus enclensis]KSU83414.1 hypothetical protein AS030_12680 [Fictibacillus enclensis]SCC15148.1 hypothetical protein GA0061096_2669 [Fictibacillus enclensis]
MAWTVLNGPLDVKKVNINNEDESFDGFAVGASTAVYKVYGTVFLTQVRWLDDNTVRAESSGLILEENYSKKLTKATVKILVNKLSHLNGWILLTKLMAHSVNEHANFNLLNFEGVR